MNPHLSSFFVFGKSSVTIKPFGILCRSGKRTVRLCRNAGKRVLMPAWELGVQQMPAPVTRVELAAGVVAPKFVPVAGFAPSFAEAQLAALAGLAPESADGAVFAFADRYVVLWVRGRDEREIESR